MDFNYSIPLLNEEKLNLTLQSGSSAVFVGANGSGKSRLGSYLELSTKHQKVTHRVGAQRALQIPSNVSLTDPRRAQHILWYGAETDRNRQIQKWQNKPTTFLLNDYSRLLIALFSEEMEVASAHKRELRRNPAALWPITKLDEVKQLWNDTIITRSLVDKGVSLYVTMPDHDLEYPADEMSDGERVLFYLAGQCLLAPQNGVIIIDEPELHLHKAILTNVWNKLESARDDCLFLYFTHDIEFAVSRTSGQKFAVRSYDGNRWDIAEIPEDRELPEDITASILGSRKPILFLEGEAGSKDASVFGKLYDGFTALSVGSCEHVIHLTNSYNAKKELHHFACRGIIDGDGRSAGEANYLRDHHVYVIAYAEIENLLLDDSVMTQVAELLGFLGVDAKTRVDKAKERIFALAANDVDRTCIEFAKRRLQRALSLITLKETEINNLSAEFETSVKSLDVGEIYHARKKDIESAIDAGDYPKLLELYSNKGAVKQIGRMFGLTSDAYPDFVLRQIGRPEGRGVLEALRRLVPDLQGTL
jgi:energy-coupling factor transporter ATP-binding protein EcfA2